MVARLKLKGIDGRAPPGVNYSKLQLALLRKAAGNGEVGPCKINL
jgi:hypothetical protein